jgi:heme-degrading monooxygenase HmoA
MIIRIWHGRTALSRGDAYEQFLRARAIPDYRSISGNLGAFVLRRDESDACHFLTVSLWSSMQEVQAFAGDPVDRAKYYDEDRDFLLEFETEVSHYALKASGLDDALLSRFMP